MNSTAITSINTQNNPQEQDVGGFGYGLALSVGVFLFIIIVTYCSYISARSRSHHTITIVTAIRNENGCISPRQRGIDENTLKLYPKVRYSDAKLQYGSTASGCSICLADYKGSDIIRVLPDCGHFFHLSCLDPWLRRHPTCPICRTPPGPTPPATPLAVAVS